MGQQEKTVRLKDFCDILFCEYDILYKRLKKFMDFIGVTMDMLKDDSGEIAFYPAEKDILTQLLREMGESYLIQTTSKKSLGKNSSDVYKHAMDFHERMTNIANNIEDEELKTDWLNLIELLSKKQINELNVDLIHKFQEIANQVSGLQLNYNEHVDFLKEIHLGLDQWIETKLSPKVNKEASLLS
ncbi:hypothetical protein ACFOQM_06300 [Paenibacillus sp. GCM10012307]|uniref:Uncharacterized protein n=1 Tax=Paenibacillus roseus TaxID=2798579 RepID=A0A934MKD1_9BACL|nr:hypothetical protein [Paenibacillus roseus]MBJ6360910.1 hypothetical protein [Paenibacillus roseus]